MSSKEYIKDKLTQIIKVFKRAKFNYEFDELSNIHAIKVLPSDFYEINDDFAEFQSSLIEFFIEHYPNESVLFISDESLIDVINPEFTAIGDFYIDPFKKIDLLNKLLKSFDYSFDKKPEKIAGENNYALAA